MTCRVRNTTADIPLATNRGKNQAPLLSCSSPQHFIVQNKPGCTSLHENTSAPALCILGNGTCQSYSPTSRNSDRPYILVFVASPSKLPFESMQEPTIMVTPKLCIGTATNERFPVRSLQEPTCRSGRQDKPQLQHLVTWCVRVCVSFSIL